MLKRLSTVFAFFVAPISGAPQLALAQQEAGVRDVVLHAMSDPRVMCHVRFTGKYGQCPGGRCFYLPLDLQDKFGRDVRLGMTCSSGNPISFGKGQNVRFDLEKSAWVKDFSARSYADEPGSYSKLDKASKIYQVNARNSSGFVYTEDDLIGDPRLRDRSMTFCLFHHSLVLCGTGKVMRLSDKNSNLFPYVMEILQSVEFVGSPSAGPDVSVDDTTGKP